jgi:PHS family inorganic phosphate transporter-like MFS transporter
MICFNLGILLQSILVLILVDAHAPLEVVWRLSFAGGVVPSLIAFFLRFTMHIGPLPDDDEPDDEPYPDPSARELDYIGSMRMVARKRPMVLLGTCLAWALYNLVSYGQGSFSSIVCDRLLTDESYSVYSIVRKDALFSVITGLCCVVGAISGFWIESLMTRRALQMTGFLSLSALFFLIGALLRPLPSNWSWLLVVFYMLSNIFVALVGLTTYMIPTESFPSVVRGTCVGLSAASGKVGATVGAYIFPSVVGRWGVSTVMIACGIIMWLGVTSSFFLSPKPVTRGRSITMDWEIGSGAGSPKMCSRQTSRLMFQSLD